MSDIPRTKLVFSEDQPLVISESWDPEAIRTRGAEAHKDAETEFQVAQAPAATPPATFEFVPPEKRSKPPSEAPVKPGEETPKEAAKEAKPEPPATFDFVPPDKRIQPPANPVEDQGIGWNVAAGLGESATPGLASALGSPVDIPLAVADAAYSSLRGLYGDVSAIARGEAPWTNRHEREKELQETNPIPQAPAARWLTKQAEKYLDAPTPENPFTSVIPQTEGERIARRAAQVGGQVAATTLGSKTFGMARPPPPAAAPMVTAPDRLRGAANLALAAPTTLAAAPPITSGLVAGGASTAGQYAAERAKEAGVSEKTAELIEKGVALGTGLPLGIGAAGVRGVGEATGINQLGRKFSVIPMQEYGASGMFGPFTQQRSKELLAGRALAGSPIERLARQGDWEQSGRDVGATLRAQEADTVAANEAQRAAQQAAVDARLGSMGDQIAGLATRRDGQQSTLSGDLGYWNIAPEAAGKTIRSGLAGGIAKKEGPLAGLLNKDSTGKPLYKDSELPDKVFGAKFTPENFVSMFHQAKAPFREAYQSTVLSKFFDKAGIKDADGNPIGLDLKEAYKWRDDTYKSALEASERKMRDVWGEDQRLKYSVKDRIDAAIAKQEAINDLNLHRDALLKGFSTGGRDAALVGSIWQPGSAGAEALKGYLRVSRGDPDALANAVDIAAANLRKNAMKPDGSGLDPTKAANWMSSHRDSLDQLPPAERANFASNAAAQATVDAHTARRAAALDAFRNGAAKGMLGGTPVDEAIKNIFADRTRSPDIAFRELSAKLRPDPAAFDAFKSNFAQHGVAEALAKTQADMKAGVPTDRIERIISAVRGRHSNVNEDSIRFMDNFNSFLRTNEATVRELYGDVATTKMMEITGHTGYKKPAHPIGRAMATALFAAETIGYGVLQHAVQRQPVLSGVIAGGLAVNTVMQRFRAAGITNVNEFIPKVMSNPQLVRDLAKGVEDRGAWTRIMQQLAVIGTEEEIGKYGIGKPSGEEIRSKVNIPRFRTEPGYRQGVEGQLRIPHKPIPPGSIRPSP